MFAAPIRQIPSRTAKPRVTAEPLKDQFRRRVPVLKTKFPWGETQYLCCASAQREFALTLSSKSVELRYSSFGSLKVDPFSSAAFSHCSLSLASIFAIFRAFTTARSGKCASSGLFWRRTPSRLLNLGGHG